LANQAFVLPQSSRTALDLQSLTDAALHLIATAGSAATAIKPPLQALLPHHQQPQQQLNLPQQPRLPPNHAHDLQELQQRLGHAFAHPGLLQQALRHVSVFGAPSYQRLEFLGDALLDLAVSGWLMQQTAQQLAATNSR
jgi:transcriptional regulator GlxA family with amidase domain